MKRIIIVFLVLVLVVPLFSQEDLKITYKQSDNVEFQRGYKGIVELGWAYDGGLGSTVAIINGYQFNPYFYTGLGISSWLYISSEISWSKIFPIYADFRLDLMYKKISPYISLDLGTTLRLYDGFEVIGLFIDPAIGVSYNLSERLGLNAGISYFMMLGPNDIHGVLLLKTGLSF
jgi:hypothetical protein